MIRHLVLLKFVADAEPAAVDAYVRDLEDLPRLIPGVLDFHFGPDVGKHLDAGKASNWDFYVTATFARYEDYLVYADHPDHLALVRTHLDALMVDRAALQVKA